VSHWTADCHDKYIVISIIYVWVCVCDRTVRKEVNVHVALPCGHRLCGHIVN